jgi:hypothetical protein
MNKLLKNIHKLVDKIFPPLKFNLNKKKKKKEYAPSNEDLDKWATEYLERKERERRQKRGNKN